MKFKAVIKINGKVITSTGYSSIRIPQLIVDFKKQFEFRILHQPNDVTLDIYCKNSSVVNFTETYLTSVSIPFPGQLNKKNKPNGSSDLAHSTNKSCYQNVAHSYSPNIGWYIFASNKKLPISSKLNEWLFGGNQASNYSITEVNFIIFYNFSICQFILGCCLLYRRI
jgi:hypothetical protein